MGWYPCCCKDPIPEISCATNCNSDRAPEFWHVDIPPTWNNDSCTGCNSLAEEWIIPYLSSTSTSCTWSRSIREDLTSLDFYAGSDGCVDIIATNPGIARIEVVVSRFGTSPVTYQAEVNVVWGRSNTFNEIHNWRLQQSEPFNCLSPISIPFNFRGFAHSGDTFACAANDQNIVITPAAGP